MQYFDRALMAEEILRQCRGKEECRAEVPLDSGSLQSIPAASRKSSQYLFAQVACKAPEESLTKRRLWGLTAALLGVWIAFIFRHTLSYMYSMDLINDKLYDLKLITASDYTAAGVITPTQWAYFKEHNLFSVESRAKAWLLGGLMNPSDTD